jgi:hypothetical protein
MKGDIVDVRKVVSARSEFNRVPTSKVRQVLLSLRYCTLILGLRQLQPTRLRRMSPNIQSQLRLLGLGPFEGREHSGIDASLTVIVVYFYC